MGIVAYPTNPIKSILSDDIKSDTLSFDPLKNDKKKHGFDTK